MKFCLAKFSDRFGLVALVLSVCALGVLISRYDVCFQNSETVCKFVPHRLKNGLKFTAKDLTAALDLWGSDGDSRPRVISAYADIVTTKSRVALWDYVLPHPSFTPLWALTVLLATVLLYKFLFLVSEDRQMALVGAAVYLVSPGLLSGVTMLFHSGKPLANLAVITALWVSARLDLGGQVLLWKSRLYWAVLFTLLFCAPFADETAAFVYFVPLVWCRSLFWPTRSNARVWLANWAAMLLPAIAAVCVMTWLLPFLTMTALHKEFNLFDYLARLTDTKRLSASYVLWTGFNLLAALTLPGAFDGVDVPVRWRIVNTNQVDLSAVAVVVYAVVIGATVWMMRRQKAWPAFAKLGLLAGIFVLFQAAVLLCHPLLLVAPGFYYGAIFSILFAGIAAVLYATLRDRGTVTARLAAVGLVVFIGGVSLRNFLPVNASWMRHQNFIAAWSMHTLRFYTNQGDWKQLEQLKPRIDAYYCADADRASGETPLDETRKIWHRWQHRDPQLLDGVVHVRDLWVVQELTFKTALSGQPAVAKKPSSRQSAALR